MNIKPIGNRILIKPIKEEEKTLSGLILPSSSNPKPSTTGTVLEIGNINENISVGDTVFFLPNSGNEIKNTDNINETLIILEVGEVLAIIT